MRLVTDGVRGKYYDDGSASSADNFTRGYKCAKLTKGNTENWRSVTTVNYEVQGLGDNHNLSFLLGNEVIKNTGASSEMIGAGYSMLKAGTWIVSLVCSICIKLVMPIILIQIN